MTTPKPNRNQIRPLGQSPISVTIKWVQCKTYDDAKDYSGVIYLHVWNDAPFYWGKAHKSHFGGSRRKRNGLHASGRYNPGYKHWIEGCLRHGGKLFIGTPDSASLHRINEIENCLIRTHGSDMNVKDHPPGTDLVITHTGCVPRFLLEREERG